MYAIVFDLDQDTLSKTYHNASFNNAYADIRRILGKYGFENKQGSLYYGNEKSTAITCTLAIQEITIKYSWFGPSVSDIRMLRIEENDDLKPVIDQILQIQRGNFSPE
mgnify:CR=1 FL=1